MTNREGQLVRDSAVNGNVFTGSCVEMRLRLADGWQRSAGGVIVRACDEQLLSREARNHLTAIFGENQLFFDARCCPAVAGGPEGYKREDHPLFDHFRMIQRDEAAEDRFLPDREAHAMPILQREGGLFICEAKRFCLWPEFDDIGSSDARLDGVNGGIENLTAVFVGVHHRL